MSNKVYLSEERRVGEFIEPARITYYPSGFIHQIGMFQFPEAKGAFIIYSTLGVRKSVFSYMLSRLRETGITLPYTMMIADMKYLVAFSLLLGFFSCLVCISFCMLGDVFLGIASLGPTLSALIGLLTVIKSRRELWRKTYP